LLVTYTNLYTYTHTYIPTLINTHTYIHTLIYTNTYIHTIVYTHIYIYTNLYTYIYICIRLTHVRECAWYLYTKLTNPHPHIHLHTHNTCTTTHPPHTYLRKPCQCASEQPVLKVSETVFPTVQAF